MYARTHLQAAAEEGEGYGGNDYLLPHHLLDCSLAFFFMFLIYFSSLWILIADCNGIRLIRA